MNALNESDPNAAGDNVVHLWVPSAEVVTSALAEWLPEHGHAAVPVDKLAVPLPEWRSAARAVGPMIGRPIRTKVDRYGYVHVWIADWPIDEREEELQRAEDRRRAEAMERLLLGGRPGNE